MRVAFVDILFSWPPNGGADVDLYHTAAGVHELGHEVHLFGVHGEGSWERGNFEPGALPFPATRIDLPPRHVNRRVLPARLREAVDAWRPDAVFVGDGFFLKPYVIEALAHHALAARYYAYELACPRDFRLFKDGAPCPMDYLHTPDVCRPCTLLGVGPEIRRWRFLSWTHEYVAARAFMPGYHRRLTAALRRCRAVIVYNRIQKRHLEGIHGDVRVVPGGVNAVAFTCAPAPQRAQGERAIILMAGRVEDPTKGLQTLRDAGSRLAAERSDFEIRATHTDPSLDCDWFKAVGWHSREGLRELYGQADVCVVPSIWEEPFGMVAVEAMACGRPVCASRVGGLQDIVVDGDTGFLFEREDSEGLAQCLRRLLDDRDLRGRMGAAARKRVETEYDWRRIVAKHCAPLLEDLAS